MRTNSIDTLARNGLLSIGLVAGLLVAGCPPKSGPSGATGSELPTGPTYNSCNFMFTALTQGANNTTVVGHVPACLDVDDASNRGEQETLRSDCAEQKGTLSTASCSTNNAVGTCNLPTAHAVVILYAAPSITVSQIELGCDVATGVWGPPP
jgi:hypothetical protein